MTALLIIIVLNVYGKINRMNFSIIIGSNAVITSWRNGGILDVPDLLFSVSWDGYSSINVKINQRYKGKMCGLLGNADGNPNNDFQLPDKTVTTNIAQFGNSWKKNPRCVNGIVPPDPCLKLPAGEYNRIKAKCAKMKQPPFRQCNNRITPDVRYIPNCEYDLCAMRAINPSAAWCQALETYDDACTSKGVNVDWEGKPGFEECGKECIRAFRIVLTREFSASNEQRAWTVAKSSFFEVP